MELKTCEYCGTAYDARLRQCPAVRTHRGRPRGSPQSRSARPRAGKVRADAPAERPAPGRRLRQDAGAPKAARGYAGKRLRTASRAPAVRRAERTRRSRLRHPQVG